MSEWYLVDGSKPADGPEVFPKLLIDSEDQLRTELTALRDRAPGIVALERPEGAALQIGIGGPFAGLRIYKSGKPGQVAVADRRYADRRVDFAAEEDTLAFWPDELIPVEQAIEAAVYFFSHQQLPPWIGWKTWNPVSRQWVAGRPANGSGSPGGDVVPGIPERR